MIHLRFKIALGAGLVLLIVGGKAIGLLASLWVPWHLVPAGEVKLAWTHRAADSLPPSVPLPSELRHVVETAWRGVYQETRTATSKGRVLLVLPAIRSQRATPAALATAGWHVRRLGPYIHATKGDQPGVLRPPAAFTRAMATTLIMSRWPLYPASILEVAPSFSITKTPLVAVATRSGATWRIVVDQSLTAPAIIQAAPPRPLLPPANQPAIVMQATGNLWGSLPETGWNELLYTGLHFTRTRPPLLRTLATLPHAAIILATAAPGGDVAITAEDPTEQFAVAAATWLQEEERRGRLANNPFRLPDGTLAYEKVPGEALPVLRQPDEVGCRGPLEERTKLWLCQQGTRTTLTTDRALALDVVNHVSSSPLNIAMSPAGLRSLQKNCPAMDILSQVVCRVQAIHWQGSETFHTGEVVLND